MNLFGLTFDHFGLAVREPTAARVYLRGLGYEERNKVFDPLQQVNVAMFCHGTMPDVEVIWSGDGPSPIDRILKRNDSTVYHLCYASSDPQRSIAAMEAEGLQVMTVVDARPALLFGGDLVSFHYVGRFGLIELIQRPTM